MFVLLAALATNTAQGSAYYFSDIGVRGFSKAGANVVGADDLTALWYNPATLTRLDRGQVMVDLAGVTQNVVFDRADEDTVVYAPVENQARAYAIPHFGVAHHLGTENTTFAFGFYPPYAPDYSYDPDGAQRYTLKETLVIQTSLGPTVAHRVSDWISVAAGVSWNILIAEQELTTNLYNEILDSFDVAETDPRLDVDFALAATDWAGLGWNLGFLIEPPEGRWAVGGMVQPPVVFSATGTMSANFEGNIFYEDDDAILGGLIENPTAQDDEVTLAVTMPLIIKGGALLRPSDNLQLEVAVVWQQWSSIESLVVTDVDLVIDLDEDSAAANLGLLECTGEDDNRNCDALIDEDVVLPAGYEDSWSVRVGGQYQPSDRFTLRAGALYETSAIPEQTVGVGLVDADKWGYGLGASIHLDNGLDIDLGLSQSFLQSLNLTDSEVYQIRVDPLAGEGEDTLVDGMVVGNGTMESSILMIGGGLVWHFGAEREG